MAVTLLVSNDNVIETTTTTGTGTINLAGAVTTSNGGGITFVAGVGSGSTCFYKIAHQTLNEWEEGIGTVTSGTPDTLARTTVLKSTNSGSAVSFSAGTKNVFLIAPAIYGLPLKMHPTSFGISRTDDALNSSTAGLARGTGAVDLQLQRATSDKVASGSYSGILSGRRNISSGTDSIVVGGFLNATSALRGFIGGGGYNLASQNYTTVCGGGSNTCSAILATICGGNYNTASAGKAFVGGGYRNTASGTSASIIGGGRNVASTYFTVASGFFANAFLYGQHSQAAGQFNATGDAQRSTMVARISTTTVTPAEMFLNGSTLRMTLPNTTTWAFNITLVARRASATGENAVYTFVGAIKRDANAASTAIVGSVTKVVVAEDTVAWDADVTADTTNGSLKITVTGENSKTIQWVASIRTVEVTG